MHCNGLLGMKMCNFCPKIWIFGAKSQFLVLEPHFLSTGHITSKLGPDFNFLKILTVTEEYWFWQELTEKPPIFQRKKMAKIFTKLAQKKFCGSNPNCFNFSPSSFAKKRLLLFFAL